jgi:hypothetical protein
MSRNIIPSIGKSGIVLIVDLSVCSILFDMLIARRKERGPRIKKTRGPFRFQAQSPPMSISKVVSSPGPR